MTGGAATEPAGGPISVVAIGGNALIRRGEVLDAATQRRNIDDAAASLAAMIEGRRVVLTHGNGPQVGLLALQAEGYADGPAYPLDVLGAESVGMIGYLLAEGLGRALPGRDIAVVVTRVEVDLSDPAFESPTKPIGPMYDRATAEALAAKRNWVVAPDGAGYRRVVASPEPRAVLELAVVSQLVEAGALVVAGGGGGIPVTPDARGGHVGCEAVIDKDLTSALLARGVGAERLVILTDVDAVYQGWGTDDASAIAESTPAQLRAQGFASGSMGPKIEACCRFVEQTGGTAAVGALAEAAAVLEGRAGTQVVPDPVRSDADA